MCFPCYSNDLGLDMRRLNEDANEPGWIPLGISVKLLPDGKVEVTTWEEEEVRLSVCYMLTVVYLK